MAEGMESCAEADAMDYGDLDEIATYASVSPLRRRALPRPLQLSGARAHCRAYPVEGVREAAHLAQLCFFLPESWSPAYKFTVFEDSYVVSFHPPLTARPVAEAAAIAAASCPITSGADDVRMDMPAALNMAGEVGGTPSTEAAMGIEYYLARPSAPEIEDTRPPGDLPEFELVWPLQLDRPMIEAVQRACEREPAPGCKRKPHDASLSTVHAKLRKLGLGMGEAGLPRLSE